jgi:hypothetical protein
MVGDRCNRPEVSFFHRRKCTVVCARFEHSLTFAPIRTEMGRTSGTRCSMSIQAPAQPIGWVHSP